MAAVPPDMAHDDPDDAGSSMTDTLNQFELNNGYWLEDAAYASLKGVYTTFKGILTAKIADKLKQDTCRQVVKDIGSVLVEKIKELPGAARLVSQHIRPDPIHYDLNVTNPEAMQIALQKLHASGITKIYGEAMHAVGLDI
jgi:hypothetical protein